MKVVAFNGSPRGKGNTWHALNLVAMELDMAGISTEIVQVGNKVVRGCLACGKCYKMKNEQCIQTDDQVNDWIQLAKDADGILLGSPTHYAALSGPLKCFLDRLFYVAGANGGLLRHKVGAGIAAVRRSGGIPVINQLNIYFLYAEMLIPGSNYWNVIHGAQPGEVEKDEEGLQIMRVLGKNMAWLMQLKEHGKGTVVEPAPEGKVAMNFIR
ncbi:MAG: flavodoxin family protein [Desulfobulbaceae bacterium]|nr:flavodoxin family protein [Desulfobulbaceae bacterium]